MDRVSPPGLSPVDEFRPLPHPQGQLVTDTDVKYISRDGYFRLLFLGDLSRTLFDER